MIALFKIALLKIALLNPGDKGTLKFQWPPLAKLKACSSAARKHAREPIRHSTGSQLPGILLESPQHGSFSWSWSQLYNTKWDEQMGKIDHGNILCQIANNLIRKCPLVILLRQPSCPRSWSIQSCDRNRIFYQQKVSLSRDLKVVVAQLNPVDGQ